MRILCFFKIFLLFFYIYELELKEIEFLSFDFSIQQNKKTEIVDPLALMKLGDKPCIRARRIFNIINTNCSETCLGVSYYARYGNHFVSFLSAIGIARGVGMKRIVIYPNFLLLNKSFNFANITVDVHNITEDDCFCHNFYFMPKKMQPLVHQFIKNLIPEFQNMYLKNFPKSEVPDDALVIHIRGSNIFYRRPHFKYGQPPCKYYQEVIGMKKWSKVILVAEDKQNPCVNVILDKTVGFVNRTFEEDMSIILHAKNLAVSRSTLTNAMITISPNLQNLYTFNHSRFYDVNFMNCVPTDNYYRVVLKRWRNRLNQRKLMMESKACQYWEKYPKVIERQIRSNFWDID